MLYAVASEVDFELDRALKDQVCKMSWSSPVRYGRRLQGVYKLLGPAQCSVR